VIDLLTLLVNPDILKKIKNVKMENLVDCLLSVDLFSLVLTLFIEGVYLIHMLIMLSIYFSLSVNSRSNMFFKQTNLPCRVLLPCRFYLSGEITVLEIGEPTSTKQ